MAERPGWLVSPRAQWKRKREQSKLWARPCSPLIVHDSTSRTEIPYVSMVSRSADDLCETEGATVGQAAGREGVRPTARTVDSRREGHDHPPENCNGGLALQHSSGKGPYSRGLADDRFYRLQRNRFESFAAWSAPEQEDPRSNVKLPGLTAWTAPAKIGQSPPQVKHVLQATEVWVLTTGPSTSARSASAKGFPDADRAASSSGRTPACAGLFESWA